MRKTILIFFAVIFSNCTFEQPQFIITGTEDQQQTIKKPESPVLLDAVSGNSKITLSWSDSDGATSYNIYFSTNSGVHDQVVNNVSSPYVHNVTNGTRNYYVVSAVNSAGESAMSLESSATAGIVDNHDGTVSDFINGLTWPKCQQTSTGNAYDPVYDDCLGGIPSKMQVCDIDYYCDGGYNGTNPLINTTSMSINGTTSEVFNSCDGLALSGGNWRLPTIAELESLTAIFDQSIWVNFINDWHWSGSGYTDQPQYGGQAAYNVVSGSAITPAVMNTFLAYVICVK